MSPLQEYCAMRVDAEQAARAEAQLAAGIVPHVNIDTEFVSNAPQLIEQLRQERQGKANEQRQAVLALLAVELPKIIEALKKLL